MKKIQITLIILCSIMHGVNLYAQDEIFVTIDGNASENGKNLAMKTIISTINQSQYFRVATSNDDINFELKTTVNKGTENFEFSFIVTIPKNKNFEKKYYASTKSGYVGFEDTIKIKVNQILSELPKTNQLVEMPHNQQQTTNNNKQQPNINNQQRPDNNNQDPAKNVSLEANQTIKDNIYTLPITQSETTLNKGVELQSDFVIGSYVGANLSLNYRFLNKFAIGIGSGLYLGDETLFPFFIHAYWNITETKLSPFVGFEVGFCPYFYTRTEYNYDNGYPYYEDVLDAGLYGLLGIVGGVQYSFNNSLAIRTSLYLETTNIGFGVGLIYHFKSKTK